MKTHRSHKYPLISLALVLAAALGLAACTSWDRQTYKTLSASKAVIDQAAADYNAGQLPQTAAVRDLIAKARTAQTTAVEAFQAYAAAKLVGSANLTARRAAVSTLVGDVTALIGQIEAVLSRSPPSASAATKP